MIKFDILKQNAVAFQSFTGLSVEAFYQLLPSFERAYEADLDQRDRQRSQKRKRARGGGRNGALPHLEDKLLFILFYFRVYPTQVLQGELFGMSQGQAWEWIHRLTPILNRALGYEKQLPARKTQDIAQVLQMCPDLEFIMDETERPIRRSKDKKTSNTA